MKKLNLTDAELKVMQFVWENHPVNAATISEEFSNSYEWKKSSTYIVLRRLEEKGAIRRDYPKYIITPLATQESVQAEQTESFLNRIFSGKLQNAFACFLDTTSLSAKDLDQLQNMIEKKKKQIK